MEWPQTEMRHLCHQGPQSNQCISGGGRGVGVPKETQMHPAVTEEGVAPHRGSATSPGLGCSVHSSPATPRLALDTGPGQVTMPERSEKGEPLGDSLTGAGPGTPPMVQLVVGNPELLRTERGS